MKKTISIPFLFCGLLFTTCLIVANIIEQKTIQLGPLEATAGLLIFPISYIVNDLISEVWGYRKARLMIWSGFLMNFLAVAFFQLSIFLPGSENFNNQEPFQLVLGNTLRLTCASFVAFLCGSFLNAFVMSKMKRRHGKQHFSWRAILSTLAGEGVDSLVFFTIAFSGILPSSDLVMLIITQTAMKTGYEILIFPLTNSIVKALRRIEPEVTDDASISYNPFKIKDL